MGYARDPLAGRGQAFVEVPDDDAAKLAEVLGDEPPVDDADGNTVTFGIQAKTGEDIPSLPTADGTDRAMSTQRDILETLSREIEERLPCLLVAYDHVSRDGPDLESVYTMLHAAVSADIELVDRGPDEPERRHSAAWHPSDTTTSPRIAIYRDILDEPTSSEIPRYYAADGLLHILDDHPSRRKREVFQNVIMKSIPQLERDYPDDVAAIEQQIAALNENQVRRIHRRLKTAPFLRVQ